MESEQGGKRGAQGTRSVRFTCQGKESELLQSQGRILVMYILERSFANSVNPRLKEW